MLTGSAMMQYLLFFTTPTSPTLKIHYQHLLLNLPYSSHGTAAMIHSWVFCEWASKRMKIRPGGMLNKWVPPKQPKPVGARHVKHIQYWQPQLRAKQAPVNLSSICFDKWLTHAVLSAICGMLRVAGDVCWCEYSHVGRWGTPCRNSPRRSSLVWAGWPSLCSHRTGPAYAVGRCNVEI